MFGSEGVGGGEDRRERRDGHEHRADERRHQAGERESDGHGVVDERDRKVRAHDPEEATRLLEATTKSA